jgi:hypothetical protein
LNDEQERYIVLLLGAVERPIPTVWHLQKEMFILSQTVDRVKELFYFEKHYEGPYSQLLQELAQDPIYLPDAYAFDRAGRIFLTDTGMKVLRDIVRKYESNERFVRAFNAMKLVRGLYDRLSRDQLLFLIYVTYPDFVENSSIYEKLVGNKERRESLIQGLFDQGAITDERRKELLGKKYVIQ